MSAGTGRDQCPGSTVSQVHSNIACQNRATKTTFDTIACVPARKAPEDTDVSSGACCDRLRPCRRRRSAEPAIKPADQRTQDVVSIRCAVRNDPSRSVGRSVDRSIDRLCVLTQPADSSSETVVRNPQRPEPPEKEHLPTGVGHAPDESYPVCRIRCRPHRSGL